MLKLGISGITGRVGREIAKLSYLDKSFSPAFGLCQNLGISSHYPELKLTKNVSEFIQDSDLIIDFSTPQVTMQLLECNSRYKKPMVIGTTGLDDSQMKSIEEIAKITKIYYSANMSGGIGIMKHLTSLAAGNLQNAEVEILETHHNQKVDSPSGTAIELGKVVARKRGLDFNSVCKIDRSGLRGRGDIGFAVRRAGSVFGEHTVSFFMDGEILEITHKALNRTIFALGAVEAMEKLVQIPQDHGLFNYTDFLELDLNKSQI